VLEVPEGLRRTAHRSEASWLDSARELVELVCRECGLEDLADTSVLDIGCGTKIVKALLDDARPIGRYVGVDVDPKVIRFLEANVDDPRFAFHHIDVQNDLYNPDGLPLVEREALPLGDETFDVIWLFSVFTHLGPVDYAAMLRLLRRYIRDDGWLVFSLFINELTDTGYAPLDWRARPYAAESADLALARELDDAVTKRGDEWFASELQKWWATLDDDERAEVQDQWARQAAAESTEHVVELLAPPPPDPAPLYIDAAGEFQYTGEAPDYVELVPDKPLLAPLFSRRHAAELFDGTGWKIVSLNPPRPHYIQHYFVARPD
jgi:SAM-dependent methyltransferase